MNAFRFDLGRRGARATLWLCGIIFGTSLLLALIGRSTGAPVHKLLFSAEALLDFELWRLVTYPFVVLDPLSLLLSLLGLFFLGQWFEATFGTENFLRFAAMGTVFAALLAVPYHWVLNLLPLVQDRGLAGGPSTLLDAILVAFALHAPTSNVLLGFVLPVPARRLVLIVLGIEVVFALMTGATNLSLTLAGMTAGLLLATGWWRPTRWLRSMKKRTVRPRRGLYVVPPRDNTLH